MSKFKVGDVVTLKSGESPKMTIVNVHAGSADIPATVDLMWFGATLHERPATFYGLNAEALRKAKADE